MGMREILRYGAVGLAFAIALDNPEGSKQKIKDTGGLLETTVEETVDVANAGANGLQEVGEDPVEDPTTATTAPDVGSGRG